LRPLWGPPHVHPILTQRAIRVGVEERQKRLLDEYGFKCECDRCHLESLFPDDESEDEEQDGKGKASSGAKQPQPTPTEEEEDRRNALALWIAKYSCPAEDCGGTMAPVEGAEEKHEAGSVKRRKLSDSTDDAEDVLGGGGAEVEMECNRCGQVLHGLDRVYELLE